MIRSHGHGVAGSGGSYASDELVYLTHELCPPSALASRHVTSSVSFKSSLSIHINHLDERQWHEKLVLWNASVRGYDTDSQRVPLSQELEQPYEGLALAPANPCQILSMKLYLTPTSPFS